MEGYAKLASLMGAHPEVAILRRFGALNAQNLLYLQAELVALESDLQKFSLEDRTSNDPHREFNSRDWHSLSMSEENIDNNESTGRQWRCALMIRDRLKEYSQSETLFRATTCANEPSLDEALLQQTTLASLRSAYPVSDLVDYAPAPASVLDVVQSDFEVQPALAFVSLEPRQLHPVQLNYCQWRCR